MRILALMILGLLVVGCGNSDKGKLLEEENKRLKAEAKVKLLEEKLKKTKEATPTAKSVKELTLEEKVVGEYEYKLGGANTGSTHRYILLDTGILEIWMSSPNRPLKKEFECTWVIEHGELLVIHDAGHIEVLRIIQHSDADKERTPNLWDRLIMIAKKDKDGKRTGFQGDSSSGARSQNPATFNKVK